MPRSVPLQLGAAVMLLPKRRHLVRANQLICGGVFCAFQFILKAIAQGVYRSRPERRQITCGSESISGPDGS